MDLSCGFLFDFSPLHYPDFCALSTGRTCHAIRFFVSVTFARPRGAQIPIPTAWKDSQDPADIIPVSGHAELSEGVAVLVKEASDSFTNLITTILGVVASASNGIKRTIRILMLRGD